MSLFSQTSYRKYLVFFALLGAAIAGLFVYLSALFEFTVIIYLSILGLILFPFWWKIFQGKLDIFEPLGFFTILFTLSYILVPVIHLLTGRFLLTRIVDYETLNGLIPWTLLWATIAFVSFLFGYILPYGFQISNIFPRMPQLRSDLLPRLSFVFFSFGLLASLLNWVLASFRGGFAAILNPNIGRQEVLWGMGYVISCTRFTVVGIIVYAVYLFGNRAKGIKKGSAIVLMSMVALYWIVNSIYLSRSQLLWTFVFIIVIRHFLYRKTPALSLLVIPAIPFVFNILAYLIEYYLPSLFRVPTSANPTSFLSYLWDRYVFFWIGDFGRFEVDMVVFSRIPKEIYFFLGRTYSVLFTYPIPRSILPDKLMFSNYFQEVITKTHAPSQISELYMNFSYFGIVAGFVFYGIVFRGIANFLSKNRDRHSTFLIYPVLISFMLILTTGSLAYNLINVAILLIPIILVLLMSRERNPESQTLIQEPA